MNLEGLAAIVFGTLVFVYLGAWALMIGDTTAAATLTLAVAAGYGAQTCFYSFAHKPWALSTGRLFWGLSVVLVLMTFWKVLH